MTNSYLHPCTNVRAVADSLEDFEDFRVPVINKFECGYQTVCNPSGLCEIPQNSDPTPDNPKSCTLAKSEYDAWLESSEKDKCKTYQWDPNCDAFGQFESTQAKVNVYHPDRRKFCSDPSGNRIFGEANFKDEDFHCECSKKHWDLEQTVQANGETIVE